VQSAHRNVVDDGNSARRSFIRSIHSHAGLQVKITASLPALRVTLSAVDISKLLEIATALANQVSIDRCPAASI
jgi:hypothetical protein